MSIDLISNIIKESFSNHTIAWNYDALKKIAQNEVPAIIFRDKQTLLKADQVRLWVRWFIEGMISPWPFVEDRLKEKLHVFEAALKKIHVLYPESDAILKRELADVISNQLFIEIEQFRLAQDRKLNRERERDFATADTKRVLIEESDSPRCYLCGYFFTKEAIDAFLGVKGREQIILPDLVDVFRPRVIARDLKIEIEHLVPVASGGRGQENLRLSCGWCNKYKSDKTSLYDANFGAARKSFLLGDHFLHELPQHFWQIRLLGVHTRCQHLHGCTKTTKEEELFLALDNWEGSPNPTNLRFYCSAHDPIALDRFVSRAVVSKIWDLKLGKP